IQSAGVPSVLPAFRPSPRHVRRVYQHERPDPESPRSVGHWRIRTARRLRDRDPRDLGGTRVVRGIPRHRRYPGGAGAAVASVPRPVVVLPVAGDAAQPSTPARVRRLGRIVRDRDQPAARGATRRTPRRAGAPREPPTLHVLARGPSSLRTEPLLPRFVPVRIPDFHTRGAASAAAQ